MISIKRNVLGTVNKNFKNTLLCQSYPSSLERRVSV